MTTVATCTSTCLDGNPCGGPEPGVMTLYHTLRGLDIEMTLPQTHITTNEVSSI